MKQSQVWFLASTACWTQGMPPKGLLIFGFAFALLAIVHSIREK